MVDPVGYMAGVKPFDPTALSQSYQNLLNSQKEGYSLDINNDANQTQLMVQKLNNVRSIMNAHLNDPNVNQAALFSTIDDGVKNGSFTIQQAAIAKRNISALPDNPAALHSYMQGQNVAMLNAQAALETSGPGRAGPTVDNGTTSVTTNYGPLGGPNANVLQPSTVTQNGLNPGQRAAISTINIMQPTGRLNPDGSLVLNPDGTPETALKAVTGTAGDQVPLVGGNPSLVNPPSPILNPGTARQTGGTGGIAPAVGSNPPPGVSPDEYALALTILREGGSDPNNQRGVASVVKNRADQSGLSPQAIINQPNQFSAFNDGAGREPVDPSSPAFQSALATARGVLSGQISDNTGGATSYLNPTMTVKQRGSLPPWADPKLQTTSLGTGDQAQTFYKGAWAPGAAPPAPAAAPAPTSTAPAAPAPTSAAPAPTSTAPAPAAAPAPSGGMPSMPADTGLLIESGNKQRVADQQAIKDTQLQKQGLYTVNNILGHSENWTGSGQTGFNLITGYLTSLNLLDPKKATDNDAIAHALAQAMGGSSSDYQAQIAALAGGSVETAKPALQELVASRLANLQREDAATLANANTPAQNYNASRTAFLQGPAAKDVNIWKYDLLPPDKRQAFVASLTPAQASKLLAERAEMRKLGLMGVNSGSTAANTKPPPAAPAAAPVVPASNPLGSVVPGVVK